MMKSKLMIPTLFLLLISTTHANLIEAVEASNLTSIGTATLEKQMKSNPAVESIITNILNIVNKEVVHRAQKGYYHRVSIDINKENYNPILKRLKNLTAPLNEKVKDEVLKRIKSKGYKVEVRSRNDDFIFDIIW